MKQKLCGFVRLGEKKKKRPDVPKWNPVASGGGDPSRLVGQPEHQA